MKVTLPVVMLGGVGKSQLCRVARAGYEDTLFQFFTQVLQYLETRIKTAQCLDLVEALYQSGGIALQADGLDGLYHRRSVFCLIGTQPFLTRPKVGALLAAADHSP